MPVILGIESSCDDTAAAVYCDNRLLSNVVCSQMEHSKQGGIIPELASRLHDQQIVPVVEKAIKSAGILQRDLDAIAFTGGPGLLGSLLVGTCFAKGLALALNLPLLHVDHIQGHQLSPLLCEKPPKFPYVCLTVSGGHTLITAVHSTTEFEHLGTTIDDAAGEAFDKCAKMLGFGYPGGPLIDKYSMGGNIHFHKFPQPKVKGLNFSFSGLKTSFKYFLRDRMAENPNYVRDNMSDLCASLQSCIVSYLLSKLFQAAEQTRIPRLALCGGVSANTHLRQEFTIQSREKNIESFIPPFEYCTDNAAMIALTGHFHYLDTNFVTQDFQPYATTKRKSRELNRD